MPARSVIRTISWVLPLISSSIDLVISGYTGTEVREILANTVETTSQRVTVLADILRSMASTALAFGMIGTLVGLIIRLDIMTADPSKIYSSTAIALITTFYCVNIQLVELLPTTKNVQRREEIVRFRNYLVAKGLALLAERKSPRYIQDRVNSYLDPAIHFNIERHLKERR